MSLNKRLLRPLECADLIRLGSCHDGGYVVPASAVRSSRRLISLGLDDNWDFERDFLRENLRAVITGLDHSVTPGFLARRILKSLWKVPGYALTLQRKKTAQYAGLLRRCAMFHHFFRRPHRHLRRRVAGVVGSALDITLEELLGEAPESGFADIFLKMDIEGSEYEVVPTILRHSRRFACIAAEFHELDRRTADFNELVARLSEPFCLVHLHGNNCGPYDQANDFPTTVELTWIARAALVPPLRPASGPFPDLELDRPNDPRKPDYPIRFGDPSGPVPECASTGDRF